MNLKEHIQRYLTLAARADQLYDEIRSVHGDLMPCKLGCNDCCSIYFELSLIEAYVIQGFFEERISAARKKDVRERSLVVEPLYREQKHLSAGLRDFGESESDEFITRNIATARIPCVLNHEGSCILYENRPITCRLYGTPQRIEDKITACPKTGFRKNEKYLSVEVTKINHALYDYSREFLIDLIGIGPLSFPGIVMPIPTALSTTFDKSFFMSMRNNLESEKG